ncbi:Anthranilate synthase, amidotransferase component [hydrothermal vent metagenome]|uniref:Anthranilate synthase, amidotransferase component n=1 Tax=hydrothermal vent metagenome TaxID=652676 RepID=A0A3B1C9B4_9ZZZZ
MLLLIDNYDSFTYNLAQYLTELGQEVKVVRNDKITVDEIATLSPERIVISPGPKTPEVAGVSIDVIKAFNGKLPIFGVCLGHQAIASAFGAKIIKAGRLMHGKTSMVEHDGKGVYAGIENPFEATRYHSLVVDENTLPAEFEITSRTLEGELMGIRHKTAPTEGVQFHPESIITANGKELLNNFLKF